MDTWEFIFIQLVGWRYHPGYLREGAKAPSLDEIEAMADEVWQRIEEKRQCLG